MEWIISAVISVFMLFIWWMVRGCFKKEDRLVYLNSYEFIETLKEPARTYYLTQSKRMLDHLFLGILLAPFLASIIRQAVSDTIMITIIILYTIILIAYAIYKDRTIEKQTKAM